MGKECRIWGEVVAEIGGLFITDPLGLRFGALIIFAGVVEPAVATRVEVRITLGAGISPADTAAGRVLDPAATFPAMKQHKAVNSDA